MFFRQRSSVFIRIYDDIGYIFDQINFTDQFVDQCGAIFLKALSRKPKSLKEITTDIAASFIDIDPIILEQDIIEFYKMLEADGFIVSGKNEAELDIKDFRFSYDSFKDYKTIKGDFHPITLRNKKTTREYMQEYFKVNPHLMQFQIELTSRCNERCIHCYIPHENKISDIDPVLFYDVLDQCKDIGLLGLSLSGGEPLLHKNFLDFLKKTREYDFSVNILSNLTLLTDEIVAEMKTSLISCVHVSLYSMESTIHDSITQMPGSFEKTRNAILKLIENDIPVQISCPSMKKNKDCFDDVIKWAHDHKIRAVSDFIMTARYDHTTSNLSNRLSIDEMGVVIKDIMNNDLDFRKAITSDDFEKDILRDRSNDIVCGACIASCCMVSNGNVYPCPGWQDKLLGNVKEQSLVEIWENSAEIKYLRSLRKKDFSKCMTCADVAFCDLCMARNALENPEGDPFKINEHFCKVAALNHKLVIDLKNKIRKETALI